LSNGHTCPILYATLTKRGFFDKSLLKTLRQFESPLQGHPHINNCQLTQAVCCNSLLHEPSLCSGKLHTTPNGGGFTQGIITSVPGVDFTSGPLGQGLSLACGMALAAKLDAKSCRVYCITGDGELDEGAIWESTMFAPARKLNNLTWIIDRNNIQIDGHTEEVMPLEPLRDKLEAFNWYVVEINGHNIEEILSACDLAKSIFERPTAIIAHTIPGKGVAEMEYKVEWHGKPPSKELAQKALRELRTLEGRIESE